MKMEKGPRASERRWTLEVEEGEERDSLLEPSGGTSPADILPFARERDFGLLTCRAVKE